MIGASNSISLDRIPDVRIEIVEGCAHNVHMEKVVDGWLGL